MIYSLPRACKNFVKRIKKIDILFILGYSNHVKTMWVFAKSLFDYWIHGHHWANDHDGDNPMIWCQNEVSVGTGPTRTLDSSVDYYAFRRIVWSTNWRQTGKAVCYLNAAHGCSYTTCTATAITCALPAIYMFINSQKHHKHEHE
jgi:hypothetical protein